MKKPDYISLPDYNYDLPEEKIAKYPLEQRDHSSLLLFRNEKISSLHFKNLPELLPDNTHLVFNETKVIHARILFRKSSGAKIEIFCIEPHEPIDYQQNLSGNSPVVWKCLIGNKKKWKGEKLELLSKKGFHLYAHKLESKGSSNYVEFSWDIHDYSFSEIIEEFGDTPIPPYLNRAAEESDSKNYQTVYSKIEGSVAAPTAGLHFTNKVLEEIREKNIQESYLSLHVGAGTFVPVKSQNAVEHVMHIERINISKSVLKNLIDNSEFIIPVGTTSCRSLESFYWLGVQILTGKFNKENPLLEQWDAYDLDLNYSRKETLAAILNYLEGNQLESLTASTGIMISPGYKFQMTDALITNFHQPSSTLLMLISSLVGDSWRDIYSYALTNEYRFLSYGDSSLLFPHLLLK